jgi:hypothetical protein
LELSNTFSTIEIIIIDDDDDDDEDDGTPQKSASIPLFSLSAPTNALVSSGNSLVVFAFSKSVSTRSQNGDADFSFPATKAPTTARRYSSSLTTKTASSSRATADDDDEEEEEAYLTSSMSSFISIFIDYFVFFGV